MTSEPARWKARFDSAKHAGVYDQLIDLFSLRRVERLNVLEVLLPKLPDTKPAILELGAGTGVVTERLVRHYATATAEAVDGAANMLEQARSRKALRQNARRVRFVEADYSTPRWFKNLTPPFDLVVSVDALHHLSHERHRVLYSELHKLITEDGCFLMSDHMVTTGPFYEEPQYVLWLQEILDQLKRVKRDSPVGRTVERVYGWSDEDLQRLTLSDVREVFTASLQKEGENPMPLMEHVAAMRDGGFADVSVEYRFANYAIILCRK